MHLFNKLFGHAFCIYLEKRAVPVWHEGMKEWLPVRYQQAVNEFSKYDIEVEFIKGIDGSMLRLDPKISADGQPVSNGDIGCTLSHLKVVKTAKALGLSKYVVFEDDVVFHEHLNVLIKLPSMQVPPDWDMIYFGGNHDGGFRYVYSDGSDWDRTKNQQSPLTTNVIRLYRTFTTHAMVVRDTIYDAMIEVLSNQEKVDISIASLHARFNCYGFRPHLAWQRFDYSDILNRHANYDHLITGNYIFDAEKNRWVIKPLETIK